MTSPQPLYTPGRIAYERELQVRPRYYDGALRRSWEEIGDVARWSWERNTRGVA